MLPFPFAVAAVLYSIGLSRRRRAVFPFTLLRYVALYIYTSICARVCMCVWYIPIGFYDLFPGISTFALWPFNHVRPDAHGRGARMTRVLNRGGKTRKITNTLCYNNIQVYILLVYISYYALSVSLHFRRRETYPPRWEWFFKNLLVIYSYLYFVKRILVFLC